MKTYKEKPAVNFRSFKNDSWEKVEGESVTVPGQAYSVEELYQRALQGLETFGPPPENNDDDFNSIDFQRFQEMDLTERYEVAQEWADRLKERIESMEEQEPGEVEQPPSKDDSKLE